MLIPPPPNHDGRHNDKGRGGLSCPPPRKFFFKFISAVWLPPSLTALATTPKFEWSCSVLGVFDLSRLQPPSTTLDSPQNRAQCSVLGLFDPPGFDFLPRPTTPPKLSTMLGLGGFRPPWASTTLDHPRQPPKSSTMLALGGFQPPGLQPPSTTPEIEHDARFWGFSTSLGF